MKKYSISIIVFLLSCHQSETEVVDKHTDIDSIITAVKHHNDSSEVVLHLADKKTLHIVNQVSGRMDSIHDVHAGLKNEFNRLKEFALTSVKTVQRDTIYITEKKNFWGRTKRTVDSTTSHPEDTLTTNEMP